ncbi:uncharacterized protein LACBIDRAFT_308450 [Laccaria bicolor S238N-H82]|uniref:Predicted protein n=1 Tax=Laccaria bicolor (strain S238N-H82 / ATCC MYA-4686) TaxID=486041 RepID=B0CWB2_LACBS|nr:uncharacterized protein LACBIDRAFT_308450 [Laccaria bicolor S238N-H82]EDR13037.1 predicted protein [Laccaria bicolor S238N-H82]|eukprot:XP_001875535.1 predicted protein [Laccaria bicolor S238N-H82]
MRCLISFESVGAIIAKWVVERVVTKPNFDQHVLIDVNVVLDHHYCPTTLDCCSVQLYLAGARRLESYQGGSFHNPRPVCRSSILGYASLGRSFSVSG